MFPVTRIINNTLSAAWVELKTSLPIYITDKSDPLLIPMEIFHSPCNQRQLYLCILCESGYPIDMRQVLPRVTLYTCTHSPVLTLCFIYASDLADIFSERR